MRLVSLCTLSVIGLALIGAACGDTDLVVTVGGKADTLAITVIDERSVEVEGLTLEVGDTARLGAVALNALDQHLGEIVPVWYSTAPTVADIEDGVVVALAPGTANIVAVYGEISATLPTTVTEPEGLPPIGIAPTAVIISPSQDTTVSLGQAVDLQGSANDPDGSVVLHRWTFGDGTQAFVEDPGPYSFANAGTYTVTYRVTDNSDIPSTLASRSVTVNGSAPPPPPPPPPGGVFFFSDWGTDAGNGTAAVRDTEKARPWTFDQGGEVRSTVADGRDYPTPSYLRITTGHGHVHFEGGDEYIPTPAIGDSIGVRYYYQDRVPNSERDSDGTHGDYFDNSIGGVNWGPRAFGLYPFHNTNGTWSLRVSAGDDQINRYWELPSSLAKFTTYRLEWLFIRTGADTYQLRFRVYDATGTRLYTESDFRNGSSNLANTTFETSFYTGGGVAESMTGFRIGNNGFSPASGTFDLREYAALAICSGWCGPYPIEGVEG